MRIYSLSDEAWRLVDGGAAIIFFLSKYEIREGQQLVCSGEGTTNMYVCTCIQRVRTRLPPPT